MSRSPVLMTLVATALTGFFMLAAVLLGAGDAFAERPVRSDIARADVARSAPLEPAAAEPHSKDLKSTLDASDEIAALEAVQYALTEVGNGFTFVWYRANGKLSGVFEPTSFFRDASGQICRHMHVALTSGLVTRKTQGVACRTAGGLWLLEG